jgi:hypothetical protein
MLATPTMFILLRLPASRFCTSIPAKHTAGRQIHSNSPAVTLSTTTTTTTSTSTSLTVFTHHWHPFSLSTCTRIPSSHCLLLTRWHPLAVRSVSTHAQVLGEIRPYLVGTGGGELLLDSIDGPIVKIKITGPAANVMTVRVAVTQKLRERIPAIAAVQLL